MSILVAEKQITVDYEEMDGSPTEGFDSNGFKATRILMCAWPERLMLARQLKGGYQQIGSDTVYLTPAAYPWYPSARVNSLDIKNEGQPENPLSTERYEKAVLTVNYSVPKAEEETLVDESIEPAAEFLTLPVNNLYWGIGENKVALSDAEAPGYLIQMYDWVYTIKYSRDLPNWVDELEGCVNSATVRSKSLNRTYPPETLLAGKPKADRVVTTFGDKGWTITCRFTRRNFGWNLFPRVENASSGGIPFEPITNGTNIIKIFRPIDFGKVII